jgi:hypothetical protein
MSIEQKIAKFQQRIAQRLVVVEEQLALETVPIEQSNDEA